MPHSLREQLEIGFYVEFLLETQVDFFAQFLQQVGRWPDPLDGMKQRHFAIREPAGNPAQRLDGGVGEVDYDEHAIVHGAKLL